MPDSAAVSCNPSQARTIASAGSRCSSSTCSASSMPVRNAGVPGSGSGSIGISDVAAATAEFWPVAARDGRPAHHLHTSMATPTAEIATMTQRTIHTGNVPALPSAGIRDRRPRDRAGNSAGPWVCPGSFQFGTQRGPPKLLVPAIPAAATTRRASNTLDSRARCDLTRASVCRGLAAQRARLHRSEAAPFIGSGARPRRR